MVQLCLYMQLSAAVPAFMPACLPLLPAARIHQGVCALLPPALPYPSLQRGKDANDLMAQLFSWAAGSAITATQAECCFPLVPHGKVLMPFVLWERINELGE